MGMLVLPWLIGGQRPEKASHRARHNFDLERIQSKCIPKMTQAYPSTVRGCSKYIPRTFHVCSQYTSSIFLIYSKFLGCFKYVPSICQVNSNLLLSRPLGLQTRMGHRSCGRVAPSFCNHPAVSCSPLKCFTPICIHSSPLSRDPSTFQDTFSARQPT